MKRGGRVAAYMLGSAGTTCWKPECDQEVGQDELDALGVKTGSVQAGAGSWGMQLGVK